MSKLFPPEYEAATFRNGVATTITLREAARERRFRTLCRGILSPQSNWGGNEPAEAFRCIVPEEVRDKRFGSLVVVKAYASKCGSRSKTTLVLQCDCGSKTTRKLGEVGHLHIYSSCWRCCRGRDRAGKWKGREYAKHLQQEALTIPAWREGQG